MTRSRSLVGSIALAIATFLHGGSATADDGTAPGNRSREQLVVGVKTDYAPFGHYDADGNIIGLEPDLARTLADRLGMELNLRPVTSRNRLALLARGEIDLVLATMGDTAARRSMARLLQPHYYESGVRAMILAEADLASWSELRGRQTCLVQGAYFNRAVTERFGIEPIAYPSMRDAMSALRSERCVALLYDDAAMAEVVAQRPDEFRMALPTVERTPWAAAVRQDEQALALAISNVLADLHREGAVRDIEARWVGTPSPFLTQASQLWTSAGCLRRTPDGNWAPHCVQNAVAGGGGLSTALPTWAERLRLLTGADLTPVLDPYGRTTLARGLASTVLLGLACVAGTLIVGLLGAWVAIVERHASGLQGVSLRSWLIVQGSVLSVAGRVPPILQLYILFFGLGTGAIAGWRPGAFAVALTVLSLYAGASITALLLSAHEQPDGAAKGVANATDEASGIVTMLRACLHDSWDGITGICVNIVKATSMASTIALFDLQTAVAALIGEGAHAATLMNGLLLLWLVLIGTLLSAFERAGRWIGRLA